MKVSDVILPVKTRLSSHSFPRVCLQKSSVFVKAFGISIYLQIPSSSDYLQRNKVKQTPKAQKAPQRARYSDTKKIEMIDVTIEIDKISYFRWSLSVSSEQGGRGKGQT